MFEKDIMQLNESRETLMSLSNKYPTLSVLHEICDKLEEMDWAYRMMRSCLTYGSDFRQRFDNYEQFLSEEQLAEMYEAYKQYFAEHVEVTKNIATDSEGVTYNSVKEK